MALHKNNRSQLGSSSGKTSHFRYIFLTTVSAAAILCNTSIHAFSNEWIGGAGGNFFDPANWSDGNGPQGSGSTINNGSAIGLIDITDGNHTKLVENIAVIDGGVAAVTINVKTDQEDDDNYLSLDFGENLFIGANGGQGTLTIDLDGPALVSSYADEIRLGVGEGSKGTLNLVGIGKGPNFTPENSVYDCVHESNYDGCSSAFFMDSRISIMIGMDGGAGELNLDGANISFEGRQDFILGNGSGSKGTMNILSGGKLGDNFGGIDFDEETLTQGQLTVGFNGGEGAINLNGIDAPDNNSAPVAMLGRGLIIGQGESSQGSVNILSKGKVHSYIDSEVNDDIEYYGLNISDFDTRLGVDGGAGKIAVSGQGAVWYQSGILEDYLSPGVGVVSSDKGAMRVGESGAGELVISDGGVVRIGTATFKSDEEDEDGSVPIELSNHVSDGTLYLGIETGSKGVLSIGGAEGEAAMAAGRLMAKTIEFGAGTGTIRFNHAESDYVFDQFDDQYKSGAVTLTSIDFVGTGTIESVNGRTLLVNDHAVFAGSLLVSGGMLQVNGDMHAASTMTAAGGILEGIGTVGTTINRGGIAPGTTPGGTRGTLASIGTLTIDGNYTGEGGILFLDTVLEGDGSATDMLMIKGDTSGSTDVVVTNINGNGAQTVGGIRVIEVVGASDGAFNLLGNYVHEGQQAVVAGAYAYKLYQGGTSDPADGDWYLRSQLKPIDPEVPLYQAGVPTYEVYAQSLLGLNGVSTLQQRTGNRIWSGQGNKVIAQGADAIVPYAPVAEAGAATQGNGVWGRMEGSHTRMQPRFSSSATDYNQNVFKMQAGLDGVLSESEAGKFIGGVTVHYAHGKTKTNSVHGDGDISTNGYGFGGTLTWYGDNGLYVDGQGQVTWYRSDLSSSLTNNGLVNGNNGFGYALSLESGKRFAIDHAWSVTPQAQLTYSKVDFDTFTDTFGVDVSLDRGASLQGRLGLTLDHENSWQNANGLQDRTHVYGIANLYYEFLSGTRVSVAEETFTSRNDRVWGGLGIGGAYNWNDDKYSLYGEGIVNTSLNNFGDSYSLKGNVGFRVKW